ncbi:Myoferlin [Exaiptasia diaphana]|nr:Myoferlin [Exaiptasia diaphana]
MMTFAGKQSKSKYINNDDNPEINQELSVKFQMPSMCEKIKLQIWDWDKIGSDDLVGTSYIPLNAISGQGDKELGYLPLFGPCFVNFYGSTREYSTLPDECEILNEGIGEGVAYRGRALVELETKVTGEMETGVEEIEDDDVVLIQSCLRRRKFKLFGCFLEATMIACKDIPIQFEISIGNYGNRLDSSVAPSSSSTPSSNAVFDGSYYYYLPWGSKKPCCSVDSHWEDMLFRLYSMNILLDLCERVEGKIERIKIGMKENLSKPEIASLIMGLLEELIAACSNIRTGLPEIKKGPGITQLDFKKREVRISELTSIEKEASHLRESATDIDEAIHDIEHFLQKLRALAVEYPGEKQFDFEDHPEVPCQISVIMWLGLENDQEAWVHRSDMEGKFEVFAETYENQMKFLGKWTTKGLMRPSWSDAEGTVKLLKENFVAPRGWRWEGDWVVSPETSTAYDSDTGHKTFLDDVYECESRLPGDNWSAAKEVWTDIYGNKCEPPSKLECPEGWKWTMEWTVDLNRAVDENGWEYSVDHTSGSYIAVEKMYHLYRRRRIVRSRTLKITSQQSTETEEIADMLEEGGWEYAITFTSQFHSKERTADMVRRRRWHRLILQDDPRAPAIFRRSGIPASEDQKKKKEKEKADSADVPRMIMTYEAEPHKYQLRVYLFQGRDLLPADADGLSDPYARVIFQNQSQVTRCIHRTLCPTWDQTLVFDNVNIYGSTELIEKNPPQVVIELFDKDEVGKDEFMGRCIANPIVKLKGAGPPAPRLLWVQVFKGKSEAGEILAAFELFLNEGTDLPFMPPMNESYFIVPSGIRPVQQRTAIEVLCWGVRNMKKYQLANVTSPSVEFECGGHVIQSEVIKNTQKTPNFENPLFFFDVMLPKEELYIPPMNIKVRDNRSFGRCPVVGVHCLKSLQPYRYDTPKDDTIEGEDTIDASSRESSYDLSIKEEKKKSKQLTFDWWSKYYASIGAHDKAEGYVEDGNDILISPSALRSRSVYDVILSKYGDLVTSFA